MDFQVSDRKRIIEQECLSAERIVIFMDGESGTWRLFLEPSFISADLSLNQLRSLAAQLGCAIRDIESDPDGFNAEVRAGWVDK